jgi:predicted metal-dependent peptidase
MDKLGHTVLEWFKVHQKNWKQILSKHLVSCVNPTELDYTMSRERRGRDGMFPGKRRERGLDCIVAADTSGSISATDWNDFTNQILKIAKDCEVDRIRLIQCHHSIAFDQKVTLKRIRKVPIVETGGTTMRVVYEKLKQEHNRKLLILFTDGYIDHFTADMYPGFKSIMFLSRGCSGQAAELRERGFTVICQDEE